MHSFDLNILKKMITKQTNSQALQRRTKAAMKVSNQILLGWGGAVTNDVCSGRDERGVPKLTKARDDQSKG